jgi:hypothetical protein
MKPHTQLVILGAAILVLAGMVVYRSAAPLAGPRAHKSEPAVWEAGPEDKAVQARLLAKSRVVEELIAGRQSLLQAAGAFRDLNARQPPCDVRLAFPECASPDEAHCRCVIEFVRQLAPRDQVPELTSRLEAEVEARLRDGSLRLPESQAAPGAE